MDSGYMRPVQGSELVILYDGECGLCTATAEYIWRHDPTGRVECADLQEPDVAQRFPDFQPAAVRAALHALDQRGRLTVGVDALRELGGCLPGWRYVAWVLGVPGIRGIAAVVYRWIARNRYVFNPVFGRPPPCDNGTCTPPTDPAS